MEKETFADSSRIPHRYLDYSSKSFNRQGVPIGFGGALGSLPSEAFTEGKKDEDTGSS